MFSSTSSLFNNADVGGRTKRTEPGYPVRVYPLEGKPIELSEEFCNELCSDVPLDSTGRFQDRNAVTEKLQRMRPDFASINVTSAVSNIETINVERRSKLCAHPPTAAQNDEQISGLVTPPADCSSNASSSGSSSNDSEHTESDFVSAQGGDEATVAQSLITESNMGSVVSTPVPSSKSNSQTEASLSIVSPERAQKAPLPQLPPLTLPSGGFGAPDKLFVSGNYDFTFTQPIELSKPSSSTTKRKPSLKEHTNPDATRSESSAQDAAPKPPPPPYPSASSSQARPANTLAASSELVLPKPAQDQPSATVAEEDKPQIRHAPLQSVPGPNSRPTAALPARRKPATLTTSGNTAPQAPNTQLPASLSSISRTSPKAPTIQTPASQVSASVPKSSGPASSLPSQALPKTASSIPKNGTAGSNRPVSASGQGVRMAQSSRSLPLPAKSDRQDFELDLSLMDSLVPNKFQSDNADATIEGVMRDIKHAPLLSAPVVAQHVKDLVPQFGFIGNHRDEAGQGVKLFYNTNVPLSAFICGVQGSGKSHTTACMLENALIPSKNLGRLEAPASALVFSYGSWSTGGAGFSVSEAVHLSRALPKYPGQNVRRITVLVSAHNGAIRKYYEDPSRNIRVIPFKLNARALDITGLRALMGIGDKSPPLYMGQVEMVLMKMSSTNEDGRLDYKSFAKAVQQIDLNDAQSQALKQRLAMLESFLDLDGNAVEPEFLPGEMTIMDLSDAFMSSSTACVLFKLGLDRFLESPVKGKMVVLDEAHKYMSDSPGSKFLADCLYHTITQQRHLGTRMIISTQEPNVSTNLIALCNMTVIHRFSSPTWYATLKRHISALNDDDKTLMQRIEGLETGEALVYCPSTVLAKNDDGSLVKPTGRLLKVNIRKRITEDGGESIMAV